MVTQILYFFIVLLTGSTSFQAFLHQVPAASGAILPGDLVHCRRNQCLSRLSCTKSWSLPRQFSRGTWCITDAINAFPGFLAPSPRRFRGIFLDGLGASPTQSMRFQAFLHQIPAGSEVKSKKLHPESKLDDKFGFRMQFFEFPIESSPTGTLQSFPVSAPAEPGSFPVPLGK